MKDNLSISDYWHVWVLPIWAALVVAAILMVERLQIDWSVDCSALGNNGCDNEAFRGVFGWLPIALTYGAFHIWGARRFVEGGTDAKTGLMRGLAIAFYLAINLFPVPGLLLFYAGAAGGIAISLTVIGLVIAPLVGVLTAGFCAGATLGLFACPPFMSMDWRHWRTLLVYYGLGGALGSAVLALGQVVFDPSLANTFGIDMPWLTLLGVVATVVLVGVVTTYFTEMGWEKAAGMSTISNSLLTLIKQPAMIAVPLVVVASLMVASGSTLFRRDGAPFPALAAMLRSDRPGIATELKLAGLIYVGTRDQLASRGNLKRDRTEYHVENKGTADEVNVGTTVYDDFEQWELYDTRSTERITVTADGSALQETQECEPGLNAGEEFCSDENYPRRENLEKTFSIAYDEDAFLRSINAPDSALAIRFDNREERVEDKRKWGRLYCRLNLVNVTAARFSVMQIIACNSDWIATANQLRVRLEGDFVLKTVTGKPSQP